MGGGGGGAGSFDWVGLGDTIQENAQSVVNDAQTWKTLQKNRALERQKFAQSKKQFNTETQQTNRAQNLSALDYISGKIDTAKTQARTMSFRDAIANSLRGV